MTWIPGQARDDKEKDGVVVVIHAIVIPAQAGIGSIKLFAPTQRLLTRVARKPSVSRPTTGGRSGAFLPNLDPIFRGQVHFV